MQQSSNPIKAEPETYTIKAISTIDTIPISWRWIRDGRPFFKATEIGLVLASGFTNNEIKLIETPTKTEFNFPMFKFDGFEKTPDGPERLKGWCAPIEDQMKRLTKYADKLGILEGLRFYGWFQRQMGDMGLGCSNVPLEPCLERATFATNDFNDCIRQLPTKFEFFTGKMVA